MSQVPWANGTDSQSVTHAGLTDTDSTGMELLDHKAGDHVSSNIHPRLRTRQGRIEIYAQPIHDATDGSVRMVESLVRRRCSPGELWETGRVLPITEEPGATGVCVAWHTELALVAWSGSTRRERGERIEIKLHRAQLESHDFVEHLNRVMLRLSIDPEELVLSIPDRLGNHGCRAAATAVGSLISAGTTLALDDYKGRSSVTRPEPNWLVPGSLVKLDPSLTACIDDHLTEEVLTGAVRSLHLAGYEVAARSINRMSQLAIVIETGIEYAQGDLFSPPIPLV